MNSEGDDRARTRAFARGWFPVARDVDLGSPVLATLLGTRLVVFRAASGKTVVLRNRCAHRGGALNLGQVTGDNIQCPYHGWQFGADGSCAHIPANPPGTPIPKNAAVDSYPVVVRYGLVWTCLGVPLTSAPYLPELEPLEMTYLAGEPVDVAAGMVAAAENFRDVAHFPFVHRGTMGEVPHQVERLEVRRDGYETWMTRGYTARGGDAALFRDVADLTFQYHAVAPGLVSVLLDHGPAGQRVVMECFTPAGAAGCRIFLVSGTAAGYTALSPQDTLATEMAVLHEDLPTLDNLEPAEVPFDRRYPEVSVESDRYTLATRRAFVQFIRDAQGPANGIAKSVGAGSSMSA
ncbi:MAG TPA: aromatic ring-hydroxylating dioxygenase subunit alpha [Trebonia sp.]|nr:aromatic ring-hydroxylating dioxygenase subunit alpha [Trebonia sp.]